MAEKVADKKAANKPHIMPREYRDSKLKTKTKPTTATLPNAISLQSHFLLIIQGLTIETNTALVLNTVNAVLMLDTLMAVKKAIQCMAMNNPAMTIPTRCLGEIDCHCFLNNTQTAMPAKAIRVRQNTKDTGANEIS